MRQQGRLGFVLADRDVRNDILAPQYYDPRIPERLTELRGTHELVAIADLQTRGELHLRQGKYIGKMHYGTGPFPYIRTSDISNWELRGSPKHGVSRVVYDHFSKDQDVREGDILLVHEGSYLIGTPCLLTKYDTQILYQHHLAKLRVVEDGSVSGPLLMGLLLCPIVQQQIRAKQLTADIIDSIVGRLPEVILPVPRDRAVRDRLSARASTVFGGRAEARLRLSLVARELDSVLTSGSVSQLQAALKRELTRDDSIVGFLGDRPSFSAFTVEHSGVRSDVLVPKYYDPRIEETLRGFESTCEIAMIGDLVKRGVLSLRTGDEVGKAAYGSGLIPFVRTSDLGNWELKTDPKQAVSERYFAEYGPTQDNRVQDILVVRDGTYLVGTSVMVSEDDLPMLFCGGMYSIRVEKRDAIDPYLLLALFSSGVVRQQLKSMQFTRDIIDTLGHRLREVRLPIPRSSKLAAGIAGAFRGLLEARRVFRAEAAGLGRDIEAAGAAPSIEPRARARR